MTSSEAKEQVLANLANFAYDPNNMEYLRELQVTDLFLDMLTEENENFVEFGMGEYHTSKNPQIIISLPLRVCEMPSPNLKVSSISSLVRVPLSQGGCAT